MHNTGRHIINTRIECKEIWTVYRQKGKRKNALAVYSVANDQIKNCVTINYATILNCMFFIYIEFRP